MWSSFCRTWGNILVILIIVSGLSCRTQNVEAPIQKVVLVSIDTLRPDFLGCYNSIAQSSPNLDRFAGENILFANATAQAPSTAISHKSMLYSLYPSIHKMTRNNIPDEQIRPPVQVLQSRGFRTAGFVGGGELSSKFGFGKGFDYYWEAGTYSDTDSQETLEELEKKVGEWLDIYYSEKFFLFIHTYEVHCPYFAPQPYRDQFARWYSGEIDPRRKCGDNYYNLRKLSNLDVLFLRDLYSAEVTYVDDFLGRLFEKLEAFGIYDQVLIVFLSDHGESLGERAYVGHNMLHNVQLQIPLILRIPGHSSQRIDAAIEAIDVMPTIFELLHLDQPFTFQGQSLVPLLSKQNTRNANRTLFSEQSGRIRVRKGDMVAIFDQNEDSSSEVYDLRSDPEEKNNLLEDNSDFLKFCKLEYLKMVNRSRNIASKFVIRDLKTPILDDQIKEQLNSLGYVP